MKKLRFVIALILPALAFSCAVADEFEWAVIDSLSDARYLLTDISGKGVMLAALGGSVLKSTDGAKSWKQVLSVGPKGSKVNYMSLDHRDSALYAATGSGLFRSADLGEHWKRIFNAGNELENDCGSVDFSGGSIYLGTKAGIFKSDDQGRFWQKQPWKLSNSRIVSIACDEASGFVYAASGEGIFIRDTKGAWSSAIVRNAPEQETEEQPEPEMRFIALGRPGGQVYAASKKGVYKSSDFGRTWERMPAYGLLSEDIRFISADDNGLYAVTRSGIFEYSNSRWKEISLGLTSSDIKSIAFDKSGALYACCAEGIFRADAKRRVYGMSGKAPSGPSIKEVQDAAVEYSEVSPEKIKAWRKHASKKALLPQVNVGMGRNVTDLWHWEGGSTTKADDDTLRKGRDSLDWDVSLTWDLGELIWNEDQTSIDTRSKLMVELRNSILDEVTKLYFERLRVIMELDSVKIEEVGKRQEKELRLREIAASIDALTGGFFSPRIENVSPGQNVSPP